MTDPTPFSVQVSDLSTYLGQAVEPERAALLLRLAQDAATSFVKPLPAEALGVVLSCAARAYTNPTQVTQESGAGYASSLPFPGVFLTKQERVVLMNLAGRGGAFTVDPTPEDAGTGLYPWDTNLWWFGASDALSTSGYYIDPADSGMWY